MNRETTRLCGLLGRMAILILGIALISFFNHNLPASQTGKSAYPGPQDIWNRIPIPETPLTTNNTIRFFTRIAGDGTITESSNSPFHSWFRISNRWAATIGKNRVTVYAGGQNMSPAGGIDLEDDLSWPGVLNIETVDEEGLYLREKSGSYPTPTNGGPVRIVDANGVVLTLVSTLGKTFYFDVTRREYLPNNDDSSVIRPLGIGTLIESPMRPLDTGGYQIINHWMFRDENQRSISILAGGVRAEFVKIGMVVVATLLPGEDPRNANTITYIRSDGDSYLRIVSANDQEVTFVSESGSIYKFNVHTMEFGSLPDRRAMMMVEPNSIYSRLWETEVVSILSALSKTSTPTSDPERSPIPQETLAPTPTRTALPTYDPYP